MNINKFWELIEESKEKEEQVEWLTEYVINESVDEILEFDWE